MEAGHQPGSVRVLIADNDQLFARSLEALLAGHERVEVVGRARDGSEAVYLALALAPDVVLMDISMPAMDGLEATRRLRELESPSRVLILTGSDFPAETARAREAGAVRCLNKQRIPRELVQAILEAV